MTSKPCVSGKEIVKNIDDYYHEVIEILTTTGKIKEVSSHLISLSKNHERVLYVYSIIKELNILPNLYTNPKNDMESVYYRYKGNDYFKQQKYFEAWQSYNLSLMYAVDTSENFIYAISNRSAAFFGMEKYSECLEDIKFVLSAPFPEKLRDKLIERKQQCLTKIATKKTKSKRIAEQNDQIANILKLKGSRDKQYVSASSKLKVIFTKEMGRHVIANEDIEVGEVLVEEDPYSTVLLPPQFLFCCAHCLSRNMNLYPCLTCTYTLYCSEECRETASKKYHKVECVLLPSLIAMDVSKLDLIALRIVLKSTSDESSWSSVFEAAEVAESKVNSDLRGCVKVGDSLVYSSKYYASIHTLESNIKKRSVSDIFSKSLYAAVLLHLLFETDFLKVDDQVMLENIKNYISGTLLLHMMSTPTNTLNISSTVTNEEGQYVDDYSIAAGAYAYISLMNHSCAPNVTRCNKLGTPNSSVVAIRPIKKGMQIYNNYGFHYAQQDRKTRHSKLMFQYKFICTCEACIQGWPTYANLKEAKNLPLAISRKKNDCYSPRIIAKLMIADKETALKIYKPLCDLIKVLDPFEPCRELFECQETLKQCLAIFEGVISYDCSNILKWNALASSQSKESSPQLACDISDLRI